MKRISYQHGSITLVRRVIGPDVWVFRYYEYDLAGNRTQRATTFADKRECPTKAQAERKAETLRLQIDQRRACVLFENLADKYEQDGMSQRESTRGPMKSNLKRLREKWTGVRLDWICDHPLDIQHWLISLEGVRGGPLSYKTRKNIKALLHRMFECAMMWGYLDMRRNPIDFVELRGVPAQQRKKRPRTVLTVEQYDRLLAVESLAPHVRVMIQVAMMTGLRASEFLGLRWEDIDFEHLLLTVRRSAVGRYVDEPKSAASGVDVPIHPDLARVLRNWQAEQPSINGWVFGSIITGRPFHRDALLKDHLAPAAKLAGIPQIGWHCFRHTFRALQRELDFPLETQQHLMRHASIQTTMGYGQDDPTLAGSLRKANARVIEFIHQKGRKRA